MATEEELRALHARLGPLGYQKAMAQACWRAGDLSYALHVGQKRAVDTVRAAYARGTRRMVWNIARRFGKSRGAVNLVSEMCLAKRVRIPYAGMTEGTVAGFIEPHMYDLQADAPDDLRPEKHRGDWVFPSTEAHVVMRGCEDRKKADRLRGPAADAGVIDEAGFIDDLAYVAKDVIMPQLLTTDGFLLLASSPPRSPEHFFKTFAIEAEAQGAYVHGTVYDAPHLSPEAIERQMRDAGGEHSDTWQREYLARFVVDATRAIVPEFEAVEPFVVGTVDRPAHFDAYVVGDLGYADLTVLLFAYYHFELALIVVEDEVVLRKPTSDVIHAAVARKERELWGDRKPFLRAVDARGITLADLRKLQPEMQTEGATYVELHSTAPNAVEGVRYTIESLGGKLEERDGRFFIVGKSSDHERVVVAMAIQQGYIASAGAPTDPAPIDPARWHAVANDELDAAVNALRVTLTRKKMLIHPRCQVLRAHLRGGTWNAQHTSFARIVNDQGGHHFDGVAAAVYLNRTVRVNKNPNPDPLAGLDLTGKWVHYDRIKDASREGNLRKAFTSQRMKRR